MNEEWSYHSPVRVHLGDDLVDRAGDIVRYDRTVLLTTPGFVKRGISARIERSMGNRLVGVLDIVRPNPDIDQLDEQLVQVREGRPNAIIALGGGSAIDSAKAFSRLISSDVTLSEHLRHGASLSGTGSVPIIAIPTTAGTGAEVTPFGTIWDRKHHRKYSIDGMGIMPETALLDPTLTIDLPPALTISTGLDAISHAFESIWNRRATPITIGLASQSLRRGLASLPKLIEEPEDLQARRSMLVASTMAGMAISQTRTALAHSMSYPLTAELNVPHGLACGFLLPEVLEFNARDDDGRLVELAQCLGLSSIEGLKGRLVNLLEHLGADRMVLQHIGRPDEVLKRRGGMIDRNRANNNLRDATGEDLERILNDWMARSGSANKI